jgi:protein-S-isoprenylcysteine O-methyltransferase Ste14
MWHCGEHFSHIIMHERREEHKLVTTGIYKYVLYLLLLRNACVTCPMYPVV